MIHGKTYYQILEIDPSSSFEEIKKAYRRLSFLYHPDKNNGEDSKFKDINSAYETLQDKAKRNQYDFEIQMLNNRPQYMDTFTERNNGISGFFSSFFSDPSKSNQTKIPNIFDSGSGSMDDIIAETIIQGMMNSLPKNKNVDFDIFNQKNQENNSNHNEDINVHVQIDFLDSYSGCCVPIDIERSIIKCHKETVKRKECEKIYLTIPAGVDNDEIIIVKDKGNIFNENKSDIKVHVKVKDHDTFKRNGLHLVLRKQISFKESLCGFKFNIDHINGQVLNFSSSKGNIIQNHDTKIIQDLGFKRNDKTGNLIIEFVVLHPKNKLNENQLEFIENNF